MSGKSSVFDLGFSVQAKMQIKALEKQTAERIKNAMEAHFRYLPPAGDVIRLEDRKGEFKLRVGDWRAPNKLRGIRRLINPEFGDTRREK